MRNRWTAPAGSNPARLLDAVSSAYTDLEATIARLGDAIAHIVAAFIIWGPDERLTLCNDNLRQMLLQMADLLVPGVTCHGLLAAVVDRGVITLKSLTRDVWIENTIGRHHKPSGSDELRLADGRTLKVRKERAQDGGIVDLVTDVTRAQQRSNVAWTCRSPNR